MLVPVLALAALLAFAGYRLGVRGARWPAWTAAAAGAAPGVAFTLYYLHWFDGAAWFYAFRSLPASELSAAGTGLLAGLLQAEVVRRRLPARTLVPALTLAGLFVPYMKPLLSPLDRSTLRAACPDGFCLQSSASTCGPASVASILRLFDVNETEATLAREAFTSSGGTESWYLARAVRRRGLSARWVMTAPPVGALPVPAVAGVVLPGGAGHFIAVLGENDSSYVLNDPMYGRVIVPKARLASAYRFTGFFMVVERAGTGPPPST